MSNRTEDIQRILSTEDSQFRQWIEEHHQCEHRLTELQRFFQDYKVLEGKEVDVGGFSSPEEAVGAVRHAMALYENSTRSTSPLRASVPRSLGKQEDSGGTR